MLNLSYEKVAAWVLGLLAVSPEPQHPMHGRVPFTCPDYTEYSQSRHEPFSSGPLALPDMRPRPECRTFNSSAVEEVISDMEVRMTDPDLARLFANAMGSTLDTTVRYFEPELNLAFIITGDITAQWLRDTGNQFAHLYRLLPHDDQLRSLVKAVINTEARYIQEYPYCGAFQPPPESGLSPSLNLHALKVEVRPNVDNSTVFECKFELDSLAGFLKMSRSYYQYTRDSSFINDNWKSAMESIFTVLHDQSLGTFDDDFNFISHYNWTGTEGSLSPPVNNGGNGEPRAANGLVGCTHRPSDDLCTFNYITPDNAMMSVELGNMAAVLEELDILPEVSKIAREYSTTIRRAIMDHTITSQGIFAYETNGLGGMYVMDDTNVPSLVSLPYLGFLPRDDPTYVKTKAAIFSRANPYYAKGVGFEGIGGPHINATYPWPMAHVSAIFGSDDDEEIAARLDLILKTTAGLGLIHEGISIHDSNEFTRPWFAWANSYFAEMMLDLAERKPHLILKDKQAYVAGQ